jgi:hypothetical protein
MTVRSNPLCATPLRQLRSGGDRLGAAAAVELPRGAAEILRQRGLVGGPVLLLGESHGRVEKYEPTPLFEVARGTIGEAGTLLKGDDFVAVVLILEGPRAHQLEPILAAISQSLAPGTSLVLILPAARRSDIDRETAHLLLLRSGYDRVWAHSERRVSCISAQRASAARAVKMCSIIVPVFNERETFPGLMQALLEKRLDHMGLEREIIVVESNSTDGTRELVANFAATPGVKILWQDRPRGKGHAVREGLRVATGDFVLIQDADLEYDVNDYDALLEPLLQDRAAFVLGSRHTGQVRMRKFTDQRLLGAACDAAHLLFTALIRLPCSRSFAAIASTDSSSSVTGSTSITSSSSSWS